MPGKNDQDKKSGIQMAKQKELEDFYAKWHDRIGIFDRSDKVTQLINPRSSQTFVSDTFSKEKLRSYMKNPEQNAKQLRNLSRFLYNRVQIYRRIIKFNADFINLRYRAVIPLNNLVDEISDDEILSSYYDTLKTLENMNLPLVFEPIYTTCWKEDVFFGCVYYDEEQFFVLPLDPDYCVITGVYDTGDYAFDMDMSYFQSRQELLELWGEPFQSMWKEYQSDTVNNRYVPMPDENCICLKVNTDNYKVPIPPFLGIFNELINLEDLKDIQAIANEQQIYKLLLLKIPLLKGSNEANDFAVLIDTALDFFNKMSDNLNDYVGASLLPGLETEVVSFSEDQTSDTNKMQKALENVLDIGGAGQILLGSKVSNSIAWKGAVKADQDMALATLLPQTEAWVNRFLKIHLKNPSVVKFLNVTEQTKADYVQEIRTNATFGVPNRLLLGSLQGLSELDTLSLLNLETNVLKLHEDMIPMQSSNTMDTGELSNKEGGRPRKDEGDLSESGDRSRDYLNE